MVRSSEWWWKERVELATIEGMITANTALDPSKDTDVLIVGAGVVGLACGHVLATAGLRVIVIEAGPRIGEGVSARNSEVIHAGLYYTPLAR
jgi:glycerol-3-phosphate dehydrogenase